MPKNKSIKLEIPCGYKIIEKTKALSYDDTRKILSTKKIGRYTSVTKQRDDILLSCHVIKCPYCDGETPAYSHYLYDFGKCNYNLLEDIVNNCLNTQLSFFEENRTFTLNFADDYLEEFYCKKCGFFSNRSKKAIDIYIGNTDESVYISREISSIEDVMSLNWAGITNLNCSFPFTEIVEFDIKTGESYISLKDCMGNIIHKSRFLENLNLSEKCFFDVLIRRNRLVRRRFKKIFQEVSGYAIHFTMAELSLRHFILMTKFTGLKRSFYDAIPLLNYKTRIDESFSYITDKIRNQESIMKILKSSSLPDTKSVRKIFYETPGLIFYMKECEMLFDVVKNIDCLRMLLCNVEIYNILSHLHAYPGLITFYYDYCKEKGAVLFTRHLILSAHNFNRRASVYVLFSDDIRKKEKKQWKGKRYFIFEDFSCDFSKIDFSLPLTRLNETVVGSRIGKYQFKKLTTTADRFCEDTYHDILILLNNRHIGDIWIDTSENTAYPSLNSGNIKKNSSLHKAAQKWCSKNSLKLIADFYDD